MITSAEQYIYLDVLVVVVLLVLVQEAITSTTKNKINRFKYDFICNVLILVQSQIGWTLSRHLNIVNNISEKKQLKQKIIQIHTK